MERYTGSAIGVGEHKGAPLYISDLPGHDGLVKSATNPKSDWGWNNHRDSAIVLTPYWQRRFIAYSRNGLGYKGRLHVA